MWDMYIGFTLYSRPLIIWPLFVKSLFHLHKHVVTDIVVIKKTASLMNLSLPSFYGKNYTLVNAQIHCEYNEERFNSVYHLIISYVSTRRFSQCLLLYIDLFAYEAVYSHSA